MELYVDSLTVRMIETCMCVCMCRIHFGTLLILYFCFVLIETCKITQQIISFYGLFYEESMWPVKDVGIKDFDTVHRLPSSFQWKVFYNRLFYFFSSSLVFIEYHNFYLTTLINLFIKTC